MRILRISHSAVVDAWRERERELRRAGLDARILSARRWDEGGVVVPLRPRPGEPVRGVRTIGRHPALFVFDPRPLWRALGSEWDLIDIHEEPYALATAEILLLRALRRRAVPYLLYSAQNIDKRYPLPFRWFERRALHGAAAISVCNDEAARILRAKGVRGVVRTIPLGVDLTVFSPGPQRTTDDELHVGYAGRLAPHKGVEVLCDAIGGDRRLHLSIAGAGPSEAALRERTRGQAVEFLGPLGEAALVDFYRSIDVLAVPSLTTPGWVEQFGRVAVEAMACGVPVVASDSGALPDVVGGAGLLVPEADGHALRAALLRFLDEPELAPALRRAGLERARSCSWSEVAARYRELYAEALGTSTDGVLENRGVEVLVVAYGSPDLLRSALGPLAGEFPITVVDNSSLPEIRRIADDAGARYLDPGRNGGFAAGVNHGLAHRQAPESDVLLLNPDAVVQPEDVRALQRALHARRRTASVGPLQVNDRGVPAKVRWPYPSPAAAWLEAVGLGRLRRAPQDRSFVIGSVLMLDADAIADVGPFDERFFLYAEETDWSYRANQRGWRHEVVEDVRAVHLGAATSSDPVRRDTHFYASQERYHRKHFGTLGWQVARGGALAGALARATLRRGAAREAAIRRIRLYLRGPVRAERDLFMPTMPRAAA